MTTRVFLLLSLFFALLQGSFLPSVFAEGLLVVVLILSVAPQKALPGVLTSGLIFDLLQSQQLGITSIIFLLFAGTAILIKNDIPIQKPVLAGALAILIGLVRAKIVFASFLIIPAILGGLLTFLLLVFVLQPVSAKDIHLK